MKEVQFRKDIGLFAAVRSIRTFLTEREEPMKCYICAKQGVDSDAVAMCVVCGMGLCMGHAFKEELLVRDVIDWGFGEERIEYPHTLPRFICPECRVARDQRLKGPPK